MVHWDSRANAVFMAAVALPAPERPAYLKDASGSDPELCRLVEGLLAAHALGAEAAALAQQRNPQTPGRYRLEGEIARGTAAAILKGFDVSLGRDVILKVLLGTHKDSPVFLQRFEDEAQILAQLQHSGIPLVYDRGLLPDGRPYYSTKSVRGLSLANLLAARRRPEEEWPRFLRIFEQVCQSLAYAHARGVIYRNINPKNILVGVCGQVLLMDWDLCKVLHPDAATDQEPGQERRRGLPVTGATGKGDVERTKPGPLLGKPGYMAPEQACGEFERLNERADVFGLGALLCEILTGKPPAGGVTTVEVQRDLAETLARLSACGAESKLVALAAQCLAVEPTERPRDAGVVAAEVTAY